MKQTITHYERELLALVAQQARQVSILFDQQTALWKHLLLADPVADGCDAANWLETIADADGELGQMLHDAFEELGIVMGDPLTADSQEDRP